jgi:hypothetical protein
MVYCDSLHSRNAGPHSVVGLLFSFQRPSATLGTRMLPRARALTAAESRRQPFCVKWGRWFNAISRLRQEEPDLAPFHTAGR